MRSQNSSSVMRIVEDTSIKKLDESRDYDGESMGNQSMMDVSMMSAGSGVQIFDEGSDYDDAGSSKSGGNMQRVGEASKDEIDTSMAGLSDFSMSSDV